MPIIKNGFHFDDSFLNFGLLKITSKIGKKKYKVRITHGKQTCTHDLNHNGESETFPLQMGNGKYIITLYEQTSGSKYRLLFNLTYQVTYDNENIVYLQPNKYSWYTENSLSVLKANELTVNIIDKEEQINKILNYIQTTFLYDYIKALSLPKKGIYIPNLDTLMTTHKGICFDFASLICCMLRTLGIPTQLVIGMTNRGYHAWNKIYLNGRWMIIDITNKIANMNISHYSSEYCY